MAPSSLKKLGAAIAFASAGRVAAHSPDLLGSVVDAIFGEAPTPTHSHTTSYVTGTSTTVNEAGETTVVVVVGTTICPVTASEASESSVLPTQTEPVPVLTTATSETAAVAETPSHPASGSGVGSTSLVQNSTSVPMTTSTIFTTHSSTITACPTAASDCTVGDVTTVVVALSTTVCPVTASGGSSKSTARPTASGSVPGFGTSRTGAQGATTLIASPSRSSVRAQSTITSPSVVLTTVSASPTTTSGSEGSSILEMATGSPSDYSAVYNDATETVAVPTDAAATPTTTNYNDALMSLASSVEASSAEQTGSGCEGMDCIVVQSNSGVKSKMNASGFALVALAGAVFLL
ncbi:hypothetical protein UCDDA912_g00146 [Diaporthe ampelina]|uniref:Extracellular serine-threonine rich protein n=1 Tax=Diaporthe ampelina TaxID=1214573 RepID=A0A0G2G0J5_9PEZI|nr:hypothetical protein UCDDA912_g00146 [Diaporthe ampelina]